MSDDDGHLVCASYTHARRHPMVLGRIAGWAPPFQLSVTQLSVMLVTFGLLVWAWRWWAFLFPDTLAMMAVVGVPAAAGWVVRRVRVEGRSIARAGLGRLMQWSAPTTGAVHGRPRRDPRPVTWAHRCWFDLRERA